MVRGMSSLLFLVILLVATTSNSNNGAEAVNQEGLHLLDAKRALTVPSGALGDWNAGDATPCNWTGIRCDDEQGSVTEISLPGANLAGPFPGGALCRLPRLRAVDLSNNYIGPELGDGLSGCGALQRLDLSVNSLVGPLPGALLAGLPELRYLDLSSNNFSGAIPQYEFGGGGGGFRKLQSLSLVYNLLGGQVPASLGNLSALRELNLSYNPFAAGPVPPELGRLSSLRVLWLAACNLVGPIPRELGRLTNLTDLDLSMNALTGAVPPELAAGLVAATQIELYNNSLEGVIPRGFGGLTNLRSLDLSMNRLSGRIPEDLFEAPNLETLHLYSNELTGPLPASLAEAPAMVELRLFANRLTGTIPADLGRNSPLVCVDVSDNLLTGAIPAGICDRGELQELLMLDNRLTGGIPEPLGRCRSLRRVRLSRNRLTGEVPRAVWGLPHVSLLELSDNRLAGAISPAIAGAANLSKLLLSNNRLSGTIPSEIGSGTSKLYELSADGNLLSGPLPGSLAQLPELGRLVLRNNSLSGHLLRGIGKSSWRKLTELNLADNAFTGTIPPELGDLPVLNYLDLSGNGLTGEVPMELGNLKLNQLNLSNNRLTGPLPPQYASEAYRNSFRGNPELCRQIPTFLCDTSSQQQQRLRKQSVAWTMRSIFVFAALVLVAGIAWFYWRYRSFSLFANNNKKKHRLVVDRSKWTLTSFHKLSFSEYDILDCLHDDHNLIGSGASGRVYKAVLSNGEVVAVKKLHYSGGASNGNRKAEESFEAEVRTLGKIRHKNIVKLWCCCAHRDCRLLVYEYMPNGSLADLLHHQSGGSGTNKMKTTLDWPARYKVALDAAEGLSYLHHDCVPPIVHRDVKSSNILLDAHLGARLADFGVAKLLDASNSMSVIAGSCGYIAPEYAYTLRVTEKSDTYSFGVVLLELVTGKPPVDAEFGDKDLVKWVCTAMDDHKGGGVEHVVDARLLLHDDLQLIKEEITRVLHIGLLCASSLPINRPPMRRVVKMLQEVRSPALRNRDATYCSFDDTTSDQSTY